MADIIQLLPESIANQIAAGEVIQRPASVVKELLENALDAGAENIQLILKESGKALIQVIDDGKGMTEIDARMSFERHATSKIQKAEDLFYINTMGFRGEALASIASIAHVDLKTRTKDSEIGTQIKIHGSKLINQSPCAQSKGTSLSVKNLFYNVPARRKFLKSDPVELRHILEEFKRVAIIHPNIGFKVFNDDNELFLLKPTNLRQRIVNVFGKKINEKLIPVQEEANNMSIQGFVGNMDAAKKARSEQFFYVNQRFIKSPYLNHAIKQAYGELMPKELHAFYVLNLDIDPELIDINIHPTKHEIKFQEERLIYNFINVAVKHALGKYKITPMIDFDNTLLSNRSTEVNRHFESNTPSKSEVDAWSKMYQNLETSKAPESQSEMFLGSQLNNQVDDGIESNDYSAIQINHNYIIHPIKSGFVLIDQKNAHERILYERFIEQLENQTASSQKLLFPLNFKYPPEKHLLILELRDKLNTLGFDIEDFGNQSIIVHGIPTGLEEASIENIIDGFLMAYQQNLDFKLGINENLARSLAQNSAINRNQNLSKTEINSLIDQLFACKTPYISPSGKKCIVTFDSTDLQKLFES